MTDSTLIQLLDFPSLLQQLEWFVIQHNNKITDTSMQPVLQKLGNKLKLLDLASCTKISRIFQRPETGI